MLSFENRVGLIAGCSDDVGQAIAIDLAKRGVKLALVDKDSEKLESLAKKIQEGGGRAETITADLTAPAEAKSAVERAVEAFGKLDVLVNNPDFEAVQPVSSASLADWEKSLKINLYPVISFTLEVISRMRENKYGRVVNIGSMYYLGFPNKSIYSTAKAGLLGFTRSLALELAKDAITVNQVVKGDIKDSQTQMSEEEEAKAAKGIPVQRLGKPEDVAYAVAYLACDEAKYVTGQTLFVCGGKSIYFSLSV